MGEDRAGVSVAEAAAALGITPEAVRKRLARGTLPGHRVGRTWRVHLDSVDGPGGHTTRAGGQSQQDASATMTALQAEVRHLQAMLDAAPPNVTISGKRTRPLCELCRPAQSKPWPPRRRPPASRGRRGGLGCGGATDSQRV